MPHTHAPETFHPFSPTNPPPAAQSMRPESLHYLLISSWQAHGSNNPPEGNITNNRHRADGVAVTNQQAGANEPPGQLDEHRAALLRCHELERFSRHYYERLPLSRLPSMLDWFNCFDALFFRKLLHFFTRVELSNEGARRAKGFTTYDEARGGAPFVRIVVTRMIPPPHVQVDVPWRERLAVLLHEMIHAVNMIFLCDSCRTCKDPRFVIEHGVGITGHGPAWKNIAVQMEALLARSPRFATFKLGLGEDEPSLSNERSKVRMFQQGLCDIWGNPLRRRRRGGMHRSAGGRRVRGEDSIGHW
ncbi:MAG: hypothetical protein M1825_000430 [Sarcosagium campestre]|nr:MAG: hypothetical protein M1825_000430 [Sarcosagium campestre]